MTLKELKKSLALWERREAVRKELHTRAQADLMEARRLDVHPRQHLVDRRDLRSKQLREARDMIARRKEQIAKKKANQPLREKAFAEAVKDLGVREQGGNNRGPAVEKIILEAGGYIGEPWCGDAVYVWYKRAGSKSPSRAWAYVPTLQNLLTKVKNPKRGHVVIYNWNGGVADHTGLFDRWANDSGWFYAIEGNTSKDSKVSDSRAGGDGVHRRLRHVSEVDSFRRVLR
jgi:hypothetical protein